MKATFPLAALKEAVSKVSQIAPSRTTKDVLKNIKFVVTNDSVALYASDSENGIVAFLRGVECLRPGVVLLPAAKLSSILSELNSDTVTIDEDDRKVLIKSDRSKFTIQTVDPETFPPVEFEEAATATIPGAIFCRTLKRSMLCCTAKNENPKLGGVCFRPMQSENKILFASTSGSRLSVANVDAVFEGEIASDPKDLSVIPQKATAVLERVFGEDPVEISILKNKMIFKSGDFTVSCMRINGGLFPDLSKVLARAVQHEVDFTTSIFNSAVRQAQIMTAVESCAVNFTFSENNVVLRGKTSELGEASSEIPIAFTGSADIDLDPQFLLEATRQIGSTETFRLGINDRMIKITTQDGWNYLQALLGD